MQRTSPAAPQPHTGKPFDYGLSLQLDRLILQLDAKPSKLQRVRLKLRKRLLERGVPACHANGGAA
jgi:hypothetical protein